ncbi:hypothetical protein PFTANZ_05876, partial [Plasmodium falciparum Tanzania (2000708)]
MGNTQSSEEEEAKSPSLTESHNSARGVLEEIGKKIKDKTEKESKYDGKLKGKLSNAKFADRLYKESNRGLRSAPSDACSLEYQYYTNTTTYSDTRRHPCHGRENNRFSEDQEYGCSNVYIKGNENKSNCTACVPPRRRHMCDQNLEFLDNDHTDDTDDLLGNVLVTAKYEGESIVNNHPYKNRNSNKSGICTSLARSFADIGDIVRGKDMFKRTDNVEKGLRAVFGKIYKSLTFPAKNYYADHDKSGNYYKLREDWWTVNRDQVWKALTCTAPDKANYFIYKSGNTYNFTTEGYCGRNERNVPTYLDYVPQFLRWYNEWAEEFCRIKKIKMDKTKKECIGENNGKNCSREGYDCNKTNLKLNEIFMDLKCPNCEKACTSYNEWIENKQKEFNKQKKKYEKEMNGTQSHGNMVNESYDKTFYNELKNTNKHDSFFELLNKGKICENVHEKNKIDHNYLEKTFSRSEYCKSCPILGAECKNGQCNSFNDITCPKIQITPNIKTYKIEKPIDINMLVNNNKKIGLSPDLKGYFNDCDIFKKLGQQKWNCKNKCNLDVCELQNFPNGIDDEKVMLIGVLIKRWLKYFLNDYSKIKENLNHCINKEKNEVVCIKDCYKNCVCVGKWIKKKEEEWQNIKDRYLKRYIVKNEDISDDLKVFLKQGLFPEYIKNALGTGETLDKMKEPDGCNELNKPNRTPCKKKDVITILLNRLEKQIDNCKKKHNEDNGNTNDSRRRRHYHRPVRRRRLRSVRVP